jgi:DNA-binding NarL/FixJ family response regulator
LTEEQFLNKPKIKKVIEYLELGWKSTEISQEVNIHINTITKVKKILKNNTKQSF